VLVAIRIIDGSKAVEGKGLFLDVVAMFIGLIPPKSSSHDV